MEGASAETGPPSRYVSEFVKVCGCGPTKVARRTLGTASADLHRSWRVSLGKRPLTLRREGKDSLIVGLGLVAKCDQPLHGYANSDVLGASGMRVALLSSNSRSTFRAPLRKFDHKARRRRMRKQPILCIGDARLGGSDAAAGVEHTALGADHPARLAHAAHE
jgi:hypothetical protein